MVHVDDVARGHLLALRFGVAGERYILGGTNLSLREILTTIADRVGRDPPRLRLPRWCVWPVACVSEALAYVTGKEPRATIDGVRMSAKHMYFSSTKAETDLGFKSRPVEEAIDDAIAWFRQHRYL